MSFCVILMFLPASYVTVSPFLTSLDAFPATSPSDLDAATVHAALFKASTTFLTVATPSLPSVPFAPLTGVPATAALPFSTLIVDKLTSYFTTPSFATEAVVIVPSVKFNPLFNITVLSLLPLAL